MIIIHFTNLNALLVVKDTCQKLPQSMLKGHYYNTERNYSEFYLFN